MIEGSACVPGKALILQPSWFQGMLHSCKREVITWVQLTTGRCQPANNFCLPVCTALPLACICIEVLWADMLAFHAAESLPLPCFLASQSSQCQFARQGSLDLVNFRKMTPVHTSACLRVRSPSFVKIGQALSSRPDLLPSVYLEALSVLQDRLPSFSTEVAYQVGHLFRPRPMFKTYGMLPIFLGSCLEAALAVESTVWMLATFGTVRSFCVCILSHTHTLVKP